MSQFAKAQQMMDAEVEYVAEFLWRVSIARLDQPGYVWPIGPGNDYYRGSARRLLQELAQREERDK